MCMGISTAYRHQPLFQASRLRIVLLFSNDAANWAAWGTWAYVALTAFLAVAAFLSLRSLRDQVVQARESTTQQIETMREQIQTSDLHHEEQIRELRSAREASLRPLVIVTSAVRKEQYLTLIVRNLGPGPALSPTVWVRFEESEANIPAVYEAWKRLRESVAPTTQTCVVAFTSLGTGSSDEAFVPVPRAAQGLRLSPAVLSIEYEDAFGQKFSEVVETSIRNDDSFRPAGVQQPDR